MASVKGVKAHRHELPVSEELIAILYNLVSTAYLQNDTMLCEFTRQSAPDTHRQRTKSPPCDQVSRVAGRTRRTKSKVRRCDSE